MKTYICIVCGFVYNEAEGRPEAESGHEAEGRRQAEGRRRRR